MRRKIAPTKRIRAFDILEDSELRRRRYSPVTTARMYRQRKIMESR
jgi:hypothetical protein